MEKLHSSRPWRKTTIASSVIARSSYDEVFGGLQSHTSSFSLQLQDYFEIFGSAASAFSIPLLDLPPTDDETMRECGGVINYSDVFEKFGGGGLGDSYEELFPEPKRSEVSSSLGSRTQCDVLSEHQEKKDLEEQLSGLCNDVSSKQFMSHPIMGQVPLDGVISDDIPEAKLDAIPEYSIDVDTIDSIHEMKNETVNRGTISSADTKKRSLDGGEQNDAETYISSGVINSMVNLKSDMTHPKSICVSVLNVSSDEKNHSPSSSYHSTSSGDIPLDGVTFLHVSEISLRTKPLQGPPPSRSPPELSKKAEHSEMMFTDSRSYVEEGRYLKPKIKDQLCSKGEATNINKINDSMKTISRLHDAEMDPSSAAALSIAAVKEAMEQAQARIKSAKEMNHKKRDKCHMKVDLLKTLNINEGGDAPEVEPKNRSNRIEANNLFGKSNMVSTYTSVEREKNSIEGKTALNHVEIEVQLPPYRTDQQHMAKNSVSKSPELAFKIGEIPGEWKRYNVLTGNDGFLITETGINIQGDEKKGPVICSCEDKEKDIKNLRKAIEIEENKKSTEICFFQFSNTASTEEVNKNLFATSLDASLVRESASELKETQADENQKVNDAQEGSTNDDKVSNPNSSAIGYCLHKKSEESSHNSNLVLELGVANEHCEERQLKVAGASGARLEAIFEKGIRVPEEFTYNSINKKEVAEELKLCSKYDTKSGSTIHQNSYDEFRCMVEKSDSAIEKDEHDGLQTNEQTHIFVENELQQELIHDKNELESAKMQGKIKYAELEQILHCKKGPCYRDCNIKGSREAGIGVQENESMEALMNQKSSEILEPNKGSYCERLSKNIIEVPVPNKFVENQISFNSADKTCHLADIEESDVQLDFLSRMEGNLLAAAEDAKGGSHTEMADNRKHSFREEEKNRRKMNIVIERDEEQEKRLKENEKDRERDKITVEQPNDEACQQAVTEALKRAERIAVERATSEARQRALADAREKAEKAAEAAKASREARLRAERAAVERATEEARIRAIEKALAEKAVAGARELAAQVRSSNKDRIRKDNGTTHFNATHHIKGDSEARYKSSSTQIPRNSQSHTASCSTNGQRSSDSSKNGKTESNMRFKAGEGRQQQTAELAANAPCERNMRDILAQREQAERDRLAESFDVMVRRWSFGKDGNLRSLLSTLEYILAPESGWQPIPPTELLNVPAVKKAYRKATLCVHPDKLQQRGASIQQKYICEKVFDLLKEAWDKFNTEER